LNKRFVAACKDLPVLKIKASELSDKEERIKNHIIKNRHLIYEILAADAFLNIFLNIFSFR